MCARNNAKGFILVLTLLFVSLSVGLATYLFVRGQVFVPSMRARIDRQRARMLAFGGVQVALSQLSYFPDKEKPAEDKKEKDSIGPIKKLYERVLPVLNRWQQFALKQEIDGIDAQLNLSISCESGKINLNHFYDFEKHAFKGEGDPARDMKKFLQALCELIQKQAGVANLFAAFEAFFKKRSYPLNDATELLTEKAFEFFKRPVFYEPPIVEKKEAQRRFYLTDLFTTWSSDETINPVVLSDSMCGLFEFKRVQPGDVAARSEQVKAVLKDFAPQATFDQLSRQLLPLYGKDFTSLPKSIHSILRLSDEPLVFCVLSSATVNGVMQRVYAIIACSVATQVEGAVSFDGKIKKVYWL